LLLTKVSISAKTFLLLLLSKGTETTESLSKTALLLLLLKPATKSAESELGTRRGYGKQSNQTENLKTQKY